MIPVSTGHFMLVVNLCLAIYLRRLHEHVHLSFYCLQFVVLLCHSETIRSISSISECDSNATQLNQREISLVTKSIALRSLSVELEDEARFLFQLFVVNS